MRGNLVDLGTINPGEVLEKYLDRPSLDKYYSVLMDHNSRLNLVSRETSRADFDRLVAESLFPLAQIKTPVAGYIDIGSGGGFPSLSILLSGVVTDGAILVERTGKKARALQAILAELELGASVAPNNFEELKDLPKVALVTLRLVKLDKLLLTKIGTHLLSGGVLVYYSRPEFPVTGAAYQSFAYRSSQGAEPKHFTIFTK
jgi:16S rRNA (guanine527-N7)-methyltransferase